jgi:hypothetical protein
MIGVERFARVKQAAMVFEQGQGETSSPRTVVAESRTGKRETRNAMLPVKEMVEADDPSVARQSGGVRSCLRRICVGMGAANLNTEPASTL